MIPQWTACKITDSTAHASAAGGAHDDLRAGLAGEQVAVELPDHARTRPERDRWTPR